MSFKEVQDLNCEVTISLGGVDKRTGKANPSQVEGYFLGSKSVASRKSKTGFSKLHIFQTENGNLGVWGKTDLDRKLGTVAVGTMTRVTQNGKVPTPNGDMYKFKVEQDVENTIEVSPGLAEAPAAAATNDTGYDDGGFDEDEDTALDEVPPARAPKAAKAAVGPDATRQARVQALLSRKTG